LHDTSCQFLLRYTPTPVQEIFDPLFDKAGVRVLIKREDLNHPYVSGNKWWKLKYNLEAARVKGYETLLTFGGAYSNHLYATAAAAKELGFKSIGIVRGEETHPLNPTLDFVQSQGMRLHYVSREYYRQKNDVAFKQQLQNQFGGFYLIPEGGTNELAVKGAEEFAGTLGDDYDYLCCAVGTGGTMTGLIAGMQGQKHVVGISVLKGGDFLKDDVSNLLPNPYTKWELVTDYHFGGYAKATAKLLDFMSDFERRFSIPLEHVYTAKLLYGIFDLISKEHFKKGSTLLILHSGGLQGKLISSYST